MSIKQLLENGYIAEYNWSTLCRSFTCEDKVDIFMKVINIGLDCFFPCKSIKLHAKPRVTMINHG